MGRKEPGHQAQAEDRSEVEAREDEEVANSIWRGPRTIDDATAEEHARAIEEKFGVAIDERFLLMHASRTADVACEHVSALRRIAKDWVALLVEQRAKRQELLEKRVPGKPTSYADLSAAVEAEHGDCHAPIRGALPRLLDERIPEHVYWLTFSFTVRGPAGDDKVYRRLSQAIVVEAQRNLVDEHEERLLNLLRQIPEEESTRRTADTALIRVARKVADWTKEHGSTDRADWVSTTRILEWHGWTLPGRSLASKAKRLEDRVTRDERRQS